MPGTLTKWTPEEWRAIVAHAPQLVRLKEARERTATIFGAQSVLPEKRQRTRDSIYMSCAHWPHIVDAALAQAAKYLNLDASSPLANAPNPWLVKKPRRDKGIPRGPRNAPRRVRAERAAAPPRPKREHNIRYSKDEWTALAHDRAVKEVLSHPTISRDELVNAAMLAQVAQLPPERHRLRSEFVQLSRRVKSTNLEEFLRRHTKYQPKRLVLPVLAEPPQRVEPTPAPAAPAPLNAAPAPIPLPPSNAAPGGPLAPLAEAMHQWAGTLASIPAAPTVEQMRAALVPALREEMVALVRETLGEQLGLLGQAIDGQVARTVREVVMTILGAGATVQETTPSQQAASPADAAPGVVAHPTRQRVDVVGLYGPAIALVRREFDESEVLDVHFVKQENQASQDTSAPVVVMARKFVSHSTQEKIRRRGARLVYANGGPQSVIDALRGIAH